LRGSTRARFRLQHLALAVGRVIVHDDELIHQADRAHLVEDLVMNGFPAGFFSTSPASTVIEQRRVIWPRRTNGSLMNSEPLSESIPSRGKGNFGQDFSESRRLLTKTR